MSTSQFKKETLELGSILMTMALILLPVVIAYYFCRDYPGTGNSPENAPLAAFMVLFIWTPFYLSVRQLFSEHKLKLNLFMLVVFTILVLQVTLNNPKF
jgi:hypothetical protein